MEPKKFKRNCSGGLHEGFVDVSANFNVADSTDMNASWETIRLNTDGGCAFDKEALKQILPAFWTNNAHLDDNCLIGQDNGVDGTISVWK